MTTSSLKKRLRRRQWSQRTRDLLVFLFFILMSSVFWYVQELDGEFNSEVVVPVSLTGVPDGVIITTDLPKEISLTLHGKGTDLLPYFLSPRMDTLKINFKDYDNNEASGHTTIVLSEIQKILKNTLSSTISVTGMNPDAMSFYYNRGLHRRLPVRFQGTMEADEQYSISNYVFTPDSVDVYAPQMMLDTMTAVFTQKQNLTNLNKSTARYVQLATNKGMRAFPDSVRLTTHVDILTRQSIEVPIVGLNFPADKALRTFPSTVTVNYLTTISKQNNLDLSLFVVAISYEELLRTGSNKCRPRVTGKPEGVTGVLIDPIEVDYLIENITSLDEDE